jgi:hypothetical protein
MRPDIDDFLKFRRKGRFLGGYLGGHSNETLDFIGFVAGSSPANSRQPSRIA